MNAPLLKVQLRKNLKLILAILAMTLFYLIVMVVTAEFMGSNAMQEIMRAFGMPEEDLALLADFTPLEFVANGFFSIYFHAFMMFAYIKLVSAYIVKPVDSSTMSCYLALPVSRQKYVATTAISLSAVVLLTGIIAWAAGVIIFAIRSIEINQWDYLNIVATATLASLAVAFICMALGFVFAGTKYKSLYTAIPILLIFVILFYSMADWLLWLRWTSPFGWADYDKLSKGAESAWWLVDAGCLAVVGVCTYLSLYLFKRRNLSI